MNVREIKIEEIIPYENNPRNNDDAVESVANSIKEFGFKQPLVLDKDNVIVIGHTRFKASKQLGLEKVPCIYADDLTDDQIKALRLADNKTGEIATWDFDKLEIEFEDIDLNLEPFGFEFLDETDEIIEDEVPDIPDEPKSQIGEIFRLGDHYLMCGDSTSKEDVDKLLNGAKIDLVCTDPPYNMDYQGAGGTEKHKRQRMLNDNMREDKFYEFIKKAFGIFNDVMNDGASFYVFYKELGFGTFLKAIKDAGLTFKQELIWVKSQLVLGGSKYQNMYEPILFGCKGKSIKNWYGGRKNTSVIEMIDLMDEEELRDTIKELTDNTDIIREQKQTVNDLHPTMKPVRLMAKLIENSSKAGDTVLDVFGGSGSTLMACEQLKRNCYMMELDPRFVDVIIERWENFTGEKAIKL